MKRIAAAATLLTLLALPVHADEACTEERAEALTEELLTMLNEDPDAAQRIDSHMEAVEQEYGGEPPEDKVCEALQKVIDRAKADK